MLFSENTRKPDSVRGLATIRANRTKAAAAKWSKNHPDWIDIDELPTTTKQSLDRFWKEHNVQHNLD